MEWSLPDPSIPVRQGDILINRDTQKGKILAIHIVITADCDISKNKFGSHLAGLRIIFHDDYIRTIWADKKLQKSLTDESKRVRDQVAKWHTALIKNESEITTEAATSWIKRSSSEEICSQLAIPTKEQKKFIRSIDKYRKILENQEESQSLSALFKYANFLSTHKEKSFNDALSEALTQAQNESLPDDVFFLPELPETGSKGVIVMLREIIGIPYSQVFCKATDSSNTSDHIRIARLNPDFKYAISQAFGSLYSRIGLSASYEARCKEALSKISSYEWSTRC